jgi:Carboxypeptidase regulatory-like domain
LKKPILIVCLAVALLAGLTDLAAQERGSISGVVKANDGRVLENATVKISGGLLGAGREFTTGPDGRFVFPALPPGKYTFLVTHAEMLDFTAEVIVSIDRQTQVNVLMTPIGKLAEEVTVVAVSPIIDLRSTEIASNWVTEVFAKLPLGRSYSSLLQLAPGVAENRDFAPNAGGNKQDNVYLYDGSNITNPLFGYLSSDFSDLDIQEVNIKRGGISAEFGRAAGMVANAITKAGSNTIAGTARLVLSPAAFTFKFRDPNIITKYNSYTPALNLSGPIVKDRLWWYLSGYVPYSKTTGRVNNLGSVPDTTSSTAEIFGKVSAAPLAAHLVTLSLRYRDVNSKKAGVGVNDHPNTATDYEGSNLIFYGSWVWTISQTALLEVRYDHVRENNKSVPIVALGYQPAFDVKNLDKMGYFQTATGYILGGATKSGQYVGAASEYNTQDFFRDEVKLVLTKYLDFSGQSHLLKAGFSFDDGGEKLERLANGWGSLIVTTYNKKPAFRARYYSEQPVQDSRGRTYALFLQDTATIGDRLTLTLGLLANRDEYSSMTDKRRTFLKFDFGKEIQPRLGFTFVLDKGVGDKFYANWGRYNNMDNRSISRAWAPIRIYRNDAYFDAVTGVKLVDTPQASETGKGILPDLKATYTDEFVVGYSRPFLRNWSVELWGQYRTMKHILEDFPTRFRDTSPSTYVGGNLDGQDVTWLTYPTFTAGKAYRKYKALTLQVQKQYSDNWSLNAMYTWSRLEGNWDLDYASGTALFYASSYLEDAPGLYVSEPNRDGRLSGDRPHVFKLFGTWEFYKNLSVGWYWRVQSGAPWEKRGRDYYGNYYRYLEKAGTNSLATWGNFDLQFAYTIPIGRFRGIVEARMMNLLNTQTVMSRDIRGDQPTFLAPMSYASPRKFALTFYFSF